MTQAAPLQQIVILGGGSAGWMAAASLANDLGGQCSPENLSLISIEA